MRKITKVANFDSELADLTYLETEKVVRQLTPYQTAAPPDENAANKLWENSVKNCTLQRSNERYPIWGAPARTPRFLTWKETSIEEAPFIRLN